jgi:hypothetical protein
MTLVNVIENILRDKPATRNSDRLLMLEIYAYYGLKLTPQQEERFIDMPSTESVRRTRQKLQELGRYPADPSIKKQREFKSMRMQQIIPTATPEYIIQTLF